jgi:hypothetical protein
MRNYISIALLFSVIGLFAQTNDYKILIDGHVTGSDAKQSYTVIGASVYLSTDHGDEIVVCSDTNGYYAFSFSKTSFKTAKISIHANKKTRGIGEKYPCYLDSKDFAEIKLPDDSVNTKKHFIKDFELTRASDCGGAYIPKIIFKYQSLTYDTVFSSYYFDKADSILDIPANAFFAYSEILKHNPTLIVQISGHSSFNEKFPFELSQLRAEKVKLEMVGFGIPQDRIVAKGFGDSRLLVKPSEIKKAKLKEEKSLLHARNRRCVFSIISWDYDTDKPKDKKETKPNE